MIFKIVTSNSFKSVHLAKRLISSCSTLNKDGILGNLFVRKLEPVKESQSDLLSESNLVYELQFHNLKPDKMASYLHEFQNFVELIEQKKTGADLVASWTCEIGDQDQAIHLFRYNNGYKTLNEHYQVYRVDKDFDCYRMKRNEMLRSRRNQICLPFSFWPNLGKREKNGQTHIYELRSYTLKPGAMIEWGNHWARGLRFRDIENVAFCGLFSHIGDMHVVYHIWAYKDLEHRKHHRDEAWRKPGWDDIVHYTVPLIRHMKSEILIPTPHSPFQ